ncbi:MAG: glycosyltransferase [Tatlockia sp.]|nr:glycosyltransferase [Tatlockia sp.]
MLETSSLTPPAQKNTDVSLFVPNMDGGGAERVMLQLAQGFAQKGLKVDLVLARAEGAYLSKVPPEVRLVDLKSKSPVILFKTLALVDYLRQERPKIILSALDIVSAATWAKRLAKVPTQVIMSVHTNLSYQFEDKPDLVVGKLRAALVRWFYPLADGIIAVSRGVADDVAHLANLPPEKVKVIYNPVITPDIGEKAAAPVDNPWFAPGEPPVILGVGRLVRQKDFATLIRALAIVRQHTPARLVILGDVDKREPAIKPELKSLITELGLEESVALPGFVDNPYAYMAKAKVFALSSIYEGFGNVIAEAMAVGTPVVSTNCKSGPAEILENGKYGKLSPVGDSQALAEAIIATLAQPMEPELLRQRAKAFSVETVVEQYIEVLQIDLK